ncbi:efflux transporter outer membrane subunit [Lysobacter sp. GX 14042]|uniref:efflux transporter outer membrane subunit n=1 Tax=Lysobacter sp. GX 14042 TaxID=2907155 RepID=UPI0031BA8997
MLSALALGLLLAGCASTGGIAPRDGLLDADGLDAGRSLATARLADAAFPVRNWWTVLGDRQLDALIDEALAGTPGLDAADARLRQALARAGQADAARRPTVGASARISGLQIPESIVEPPIGGEFNTSGVLMLNLSWSPDLWGGQRARWQSALGEARATEVEAQAARLTLAANIARSYIGLAQAFETRDAAVADRARAGRLLELGRQRVEAGLDSELQLRQAESAIASAGEQAEAAQAQIDSQRNTLAALLGKGPDRGLEIERPALLAAPAPRLPDVLPSELLGHRPDVVAARWRVEAAHQGVEADRAAFRPSVNLAAIAGLAAGSLSDLFGSDALLLQGGPALSLPIFDGERLRGRLAESSATQDLAVAQYNQQLLDALREVTGALQAARSLDARLVEATRAREAADAAAGIARTRYQAGLGNQLDVLAAEEPLARLDQQLASLRAQRLAATVALDQALGGGLAPAAPSLSTVPDRTRPQ